MRANKDYIKIPATFYRNFGNELPSIVTLEHHITGNCFTSNVKICYGKPYFIGGIENIRQLYYIPTGAILWFNYVGRGRFKFKIPMGNIAQSPASWDLSQLERYPPQPRQNNPLAGRNPSRRHLPRPSSAPHPVRPQRTNIVHSNSHRAPHVGPNRVNSLAAAHDENLLWTTTLSTALARGNQAMVVPSAAWRNVSYHSKNFSCPAP
ncbi:DNA-binding barrel domain superfamily [Sesbania bispinosa]|nr:DNA-binding barrel domain superfamily [Sesbania bispinosa]